MSENKIKLKMFGVSFFLLFIVLQAKYGVGGARVFLFLITFASSVVTILFVLKRLFNVGLMYPFKLIVVTTCISTCMGGYYSFYEPQNAELLLYLSFGTSSSICVAIALGNLFRK